MNQQMWRSVMFNQRVGNLQRFKYALLMPDVKRWTIIPTLRSQSVAEHAFNVSIIADAFCEQLGYGRGSVVRVDAMRWALWHDAEEIYTGDFPTPVKAHIPKHVLDELKSMAGVEQELEKCGGEEAFNIVKLADMVESVRFLNTWGVEPSKTTIVTSIKGRIRDMLETYPNFLGDVALLASKFMEGGDITWWMERLRPEVEESLPLKSRKKPLNDISLIMQPMKDSLLQSAMIQQTQFGQTSMPKSTRSIKRERSGSKKLKSR